MFKAGFIKILKTSWSEHSCYLSTHFFHTGVGGFIIFETLITRLTGKVVT
jgi:hypothetical protein